MITCEGVVYILAIAFQFSGAVLLIINYWKPTRKLIDEELEKNPYVDGTTLYLPGRSEQEATETVWLNRFAFLLIAAGYIVGIFGDVQNCNKWIVAIAVLALALVITLVIRGIVSGLIKRCKAT